MTVYVDTARNPYGRMIMSHMAADKEMELHVMAIEIGLKREWFQGGHRPHYDLCQSKKCEAIKLGAIEVSPKELVKIIRRTK